MRLTKARFNAAAWRQALGGKAEPYPHRVPERTMVRRAVAIDVDRPDARLVDPLSAAVEHRKSPHLILEPVAADCRKAAE